MGLPGFGLDFPVLFCFQSHSCLANASFLCPTVASPESVWAPESDYCMLGGSSTIIKHRPHVHRAQGLMSTGAFHSIQGDSVWQDPTTTRDSYQRLELEADPEKP